ncbi:hypothetical protein N7522_004973 [Penicillium canescens]|uniref:Uncharacterized protein n=1 Tax=Penicillium canescens TaxID=5083 RepID=A0AAD6I1L3_PENCN|nr:uncharacterized protein N7446_004860 [Penicillium canescens]KAJ6009957.1 hypothetical protein N7522_004973 [Penicillium canescens]KAJ6026539.1 hypothetical protein N7460_011356 [Penicillium canescens]KAJ6039824.1 hypothetical protein N7444_008729 [Penicillium canescens]KAJ6067823.1 hypothetical protein N7446_004860 [Penicillium canescens]
MKLSMVTIAMSASLALATPLNRRSDEFTKRALTAEEADEITRRALNAQQIGDKRAFAGEDGVYITKSGAMDFR